MEKEQSDVSLFQERAAILATCSASSLQCASLRRTPRWPPKFWRKQLQPWRPPFLHSSHGCDPFWIAATWRLSFMHSSRGGHPNNCHMKVDSWHPWTQPLLDSSRTEATFNAWLPWRLPFLHSRCGSHHLHRSYLLKGHCFCIEDLEISLTAWQPW